MPHVICLAVNNVAHEDRVLHNVIETEVIPGHQHSVSGSRQKLCLRDNTKLRKVLQFINGVQNLICDFSCRFRSDLQLVVRCNIPNLEPGFCEKPELSSHDKKASVTGFNRARRF